MKFEDFKKAGVGSHLGLRISDFAFWASAGDARPRVAA